MMANPNITYRPQMSSGQEKQAGIALIAVLLFLILITIVGVIAVRQSSVDLKVATADQANALMMNASDSLLADIEQSSKIPTASSSQIQKELYERMLSSQDGILGYFGIKPDEKVGDQLHFCYRPSNEHLFSLKQARILKRGGGYDRKNGPGLKVAVCNSEKATDYVSARNTTMTQVAIKGLDSETRMPFSVNVRGQQTAIGTTAQVPSISIHSVTVLPALSKADNATLSECLGRPVGDNVSDKTYGNEGKNGNMSTCLRDNGIPSVALVEDGLMEEQVEGGYNSDTATVDNTGCNSDSDCKAALEGGVPKFPK